MEDSPLELYQKAYNLHYGENKIAEACDIYERLIREFPSSDACAYASIQLQKIKANDMLKGMARRRGGPGALVISLLVVNFLLVAGVGVCLFFAINQINTNNKNQFFLSNILGKMYVGKDDEALTLLEELKITTRNDILPFSLSAEIYQKNNQYLRARAEYEKYQRLYPGNPIVAEYIRKINREEDAYIKHKMREQKVKEEIPEEVMESLDRKASPKPAVRSPSKSRGPVSRRPKLLVNPDSVSFF